MSGWFQSKNVGFNRKTYRLPLVNLILVGAFCLALSFDGRGQSLTQQQRRIVRKTITEQFGVDEADKARLYPGSCDFCICGKDTLYNVNGYLYVFKVLGDSCVRLDKSMFHGFNFERNLFCYDHEMYALGGYGGFKSNNLLLKYGKTSNEWSYVHCTGTPPKDILGAAFVSRDTLYSFANVTPGNNVMPNTSDSCVYALDLKRKIWSKTSFFYTDALGATYKFLVIDNYLVWIKDFQTVIANILEKKFIVIPNDLYKIDRNSRFETLVNRKVAVFGSDLSTKASSYQAKLDLAQVWGDKRYKHEALFSTRTHMKSATASWKIFFAVLALGGIVFALYYFLRRTKTTATETIQAAEVPDVKEEQKSSRAVDHLYHKLSSAAPLSISIDELDDLLEISHLTFDSKKLKRHRLIKELNTEYPDLIRRERSAEDQRQFIYKIMNPE